MKLETKVRKWGGSFGIILPKEVFDNENLSEGDKVVVEVRKTHKAKEFFGLLSGWKRPTQKIKDEMRKSWE